VGEVEAMNKLREARIKELEDANQKIHDLCNEKQDMLESRTKDMEQIQKNSEDAREKYLQSTKEVQTLMEQLMETKKKYLQDFADCEEEIALLKKLNAQKEEQIAHALALSSELEKQNLALKKENEDIKKENEDIKKENEDIKKQKDDLFAQIKELKATINKQGEKGKVALAGNDDAKSENRIVLSKINFVDII